MNEIESKTEVKIVELTNFEFFSIRFLLETYIKEMEETGISKDLLIDDYNLLSKFLEKKAGV